MKEANEFESWANKLVEGTWALPETPEAKDKLYSLLAQELPVGPDAANATEQLYDILGDDELFDRLGELADRDANADARPVIIARMKEMGMEVPGVKDTPEVNEGDNLATFEGDTEDAIAAFLSRGGEVQRGKYHKPRKSEKTDYGSRHIGTLGGKGTKGTVSGLGANTRVGAKPVVAVEDSALESMGATVAGAVATLEEGSSDYVGNAIEDLRMSKPGLDRETFLDELYSYLDAQYGKRVADMTMDHGNDAEYDEYYASYSDLAEGSKDSAPKMGSQERKLAQGALKGAKDMSAALGLVRGKDGVLRPPETKKKGVGEDSTDPMDHRGAVTDSFYEDLDRLKKLAFVKRT